MERQRSGRQPSPTGVGRPEDEARLVEHRNEDSAEQALLLKPAEDAGELRLTFALQRSRFVQFLARPEFVAAGTHSPRTP